MWVLILYVAVLVGLSLLKTREVSSRAVYLFRAFFPSWKFFEDYAEAPVLFHRVCGTEWGEWTVSLPPLQRRWSLVFLNPTGNAHLAYGSLLQHLVSDLQTIDENKPEQLAETVSYRLVNNLVLQQIAEEKHSQVASYQFKVCAASIDGDSFEEFLISPVYTLDASSRVQR